MKQKQRIFRERNEIFPRAWERIIGLFDLLEKTNLQGSKPDEHGANHRTFKQRSYTLD